MATSGSYYFYIVNRFDSLIYENEFQKNEKKFMAHASLDFLDEKLMTKSSNTYFPNIDRFNEWSITAFVTPSYLRFIILHDFKNDDGIKSFCQEVYETYIKYLLNPFYNHNEPIKSESFDRKVIIAAKKFLAI